MKYLRLLISVVLILSVLAYAGPNKANISKSFALNLTQANDCPAFNELLNSDKSLAMDLVKLPEFANTSCLYDKNIRKLLFVLKEASDQSRHNLKRLLLTRKTIRIKTNGRLN